MSGCCQMSVELPEAHILATQMSKVLIGKVVQAYELQNCQNLQKLGCVNKDASAFGRLVDGKVVSVVSRGNVILVKFSNDWNLVLAPEYGGIILSKNCHMRFTKYLFPHQLYGHKKDYVEAIANASAEKLAHLIKLCGVLLQTKAYLFWSAS